MRYLWMAGLHMNTVVANYHIWSRGAWIPHTFEVAVTGVVGCPVTGLNCGDHFKCSIVSSNHGSQFTYIHTCRALTLNGGLWSASCPREIFYSTHWTGSWLFCLLTLVHVENFSVPARNRTPILRSFSP